MSSLMCSMDGHSCVLLLGLPLHASQGLCFISLAGTLMSFLSKKKNCKSSGQIPNGHLSESETNLRL